MKISYTSRTILGDFAPILLARTRNLNLIKLLISFNLFLFSQVNAESLACKNYFFSREHHFTLFEESDFTDSQTLINGNQHYHISRNEVDELPDTHFAGAGTKAAFRANYKNEDVFIKIPSRQIFEQTLLYKTLSDIGIGPKFLGMMNIHGHPAIVMQYISGVHIDGLKPISRHIQLSMKSYNRLIEIKNHLIQLKLVDGFDLQFRFTPKGDIFVIDPEKIRYADWESYRDAIENQYSPETAARGNTLVEINKLLAMIQENLIATQKWNPQEIVGEP